MPELEEAITALFLLAYYHTMVFVDIDNSRSL